MLRITKVDKETLRVEGRVAGPWVGELRRSVDEHLARSARLVLDLVGVTYADAAGALLLRELQEAPAELRNLSPFVSELLRRRPR